MNDLALLQELDLPLFILNEEKPTLAYDAPSRCYPFVICVNEAQAEFTPEHQTQLEKIMGFLGYTPTDYQLVFKDQTFNDECDLSLSFGEGLGCKAKRSFKTHSISMMLQNPACKREVLHVIQSLKRAN